MMRKLLLFASLLPCILFSQTYNIAELGAKGDGKTDNTSIIQQAIDKCSQTGGTVLFPAGKYATGTIFLKSNVNIHLSTGAVWLGITDISKYPAIPYDSVTLNHRMIQKSIIYAKDVHDISISGFGSINGNGDQKVFQTNKDDDPMRPYGLRLVRCRNVKIEGITLENMANWTEHYYNCTNLQIHNIRVYGHSNINNDGMDIDGCKNVTVSDCIIDCTDDLICLKSQNPWVCENVTVTNCILSTHCAAIKFGTASYGGFKNVTISNIVVKPSRAKIKYTASGYWEGIAGIALEAVDGGFIENVLINNVILDSVHTPIFIKAGRRNVAIPELGPNNRTSYVKNISLSNITAKHAGIISSSITGMPGSYVEDIYLSNVQISSKGGGNSHDTALYVMENDKSFPGSVMFMSHLPSWAFYIRHVKNIHFDHVQLSMENKDDRPAFVLDDVNDANLESTTEKGKDEVTSVILRSDRIKINSKPINNTVFRASEQKKLTADTEKGLIANLTFEKIKENKVDDFTAKTIKVKQDKGIKGSAAIFDGTAYIDLGNIQSLNSIKEMSLCFWMKVDNTSENKYYRIFGKKKFWDEPTGFDCEINPFTRIFKCSGATPDLLLQGTFEHSYDNQWHYYVVSLWDNRLNVYIDGQPAGKDDYVAMPVANDDPFVIGATALPDNFFKGALDEFRIYSRALNAREALALYQLYKK